MNSEQMTPTQGPQCAMARYTFGDDTRAVERLALVAKAYEPVSGSFLECRAPISPGVATDLGCGPGFSTRLISRVCTPRELIGFDSSPESLASATARVRNARFIEHDVTRTPLPVAPVDMLYARLVLAHLPDPETVVERWLEQLLPEGVLLIEELEHVEAPHGPLRDYEEVSTAIVQQGGGLMYAGPALQAFGGTCVPVTVDTATAAVIYRFTVRRWLDHPPSGIPQDQLVELEKQLSQLANERGHGSVSWIVRQISISP